MRTLLLFASTAVYAATDCSVCHVEQAKKFAETSMRRALIPVHEGRILQDNPVLTYSLGPYRYAIARGVYSVTDGKAEIARPILWAFGMGKAGQTYLFEYNGSYYESRVSYYDAVKGLGLTVGAPAGTPANLEEAVGHKLPERDTNDCFGCHSVPGANVTARIMNGSLQPGLQCASCHTGAEKHAANPTAKPARFATHTAEEISDLCGKCHRTWADIAANGPFGVANVRFQPYRLANSRCYDASDRRISCVACHDPHGRDEEVRQRSDASCRSCHGTHAGAKTARVCKTGSNNCASCHMPRYEIENSHHLFPDHQIRIARPHDPYPN